MFYSYVLKSINFDFYYKGHCQNMTERLSQHNSGLTSSIKKFAPFEVKYLEEFETRAEAVLREKYFKSAARRRYIKQKLAS